MHLNNEKNTWLKTKPGSYFLFIILGLQPPGNILFVKPKGLNYFEI